MKQASYCLFETPIGVCGMAWRQPDDSRVPPVVTSFQLPEATPQATESRIAQKSNSRHPSVPSPPIADLIEKIRRHLQGQVHDFRDVSIDLNDVVPFFQKVYEVVRAIPPGQTRTYGEIAKA